MYFVYKRSSFLCTIVMLFLLLFSAETFAKASCDHTEQIEQILKSHKIMTNFDSNYLSCRVLPQNPNRILIAYADWIASEQDENVGDFQLTFLQLDRLSSKVQSIFRVSERINSDAVELNSIALDLAPYQVTQYRPLIGIRLSYANRSQPNPFSMIVLNLYDLKSKSIVLDGFVVDRYQAETDTRCNADIEERHSVLVMQRGKENSYFDLQVRSKINQYQMQGTTGNCKESKHQKSQQSFVLKFDGKQYQLPKQFKDEYQY